MRVAPTLFLAALCAGCAYYPPPPPAYYAAPADAPPAENCREFDTPVTVNGRQENAHGTACLQADGSWRIQQDGPDAPAPYVVPRTVYAPYYPPAYYADPWYYGPPIFAGGIFIGGGWGFGHHHGGWRGNWRGRGFRR